MTQHVSSNISIVVFLDKEFDYLKEFIDCKIDLFMIVNFMR